jgi:hypothetical protein
MELLLVRATDELKKHDAVLADVIGREHEAERITPKRVRPQVDRPLLPSEMPVREIKVRALLVVVIPVVAAQGSRRQRVLGASLTNGGFRRCIVGAGVIKQPLPQ